jgi:hypothetical protein
MTGGSMTATVKPRKNLEAYLHKEDMHMQWTCLSSAARQLVAKQEKLT